MPELWVLNQHYPPDLPATGVVLEALLPRLVPLGWDIRVICGDPLLPDPAVPRPRRRSRRGGVEVQRLPTWNRRRGTAGRLLHYLSYAGGAGGLLTLGARPDILLVLSTPPVLGGALGWWTRRLRGVPYVYHLQDLYPDLLADSRYAGSALESLAWRLARPVEAEAARIVPIGHTMADTLTARGVDSQRIRVIPNAVDVDELAGGHGEDWLRTLEPAPQGLRVLFAGNLGFAQGLDTILEAARELDRGGDPVTFLLVGEGDARPALEARARKLRLGNLRFLPFVPRRLLPAMLAAGDIGLVPLRPGLARYLVPSKLFSHWAAGRPVLLAADADSEPATLLAESRGGLRVDPGDPQALVEGIRRVAAWSPQERERAGQRGHRLARQRFAPEAVAAAWDRLLRELLADPERQSA